MGETGSNRGSDPVRLLVAWLAILPASPFAAIIFDVVLHAPAPAWLPLANLGASVAMLALAQVLPTLRPIRGYLQSITALVLALLNFRAVRAWRANWGR